MCWDTCNRNENKVLSTLFFCVRECWPENSVMQQLRVMFPGVNGLTLSTLPSHVSFCGEFAPVWNLELPNFEVKAAVVYRILQPKK